jgi:hypothetical protein
MEEVIQNRRQWLQSALLAPACLTLRAAAKNFWDHKDPASWSAAEKQTLLNQSPWAREGFVRMEAEKNLNKGPGYGNDGKPITGAPPVRPGDPPGGAKSVPLGEEVPRFPDPTANRPVQFRLLARWESATPVRLAGGPPVPELTGEVYVLRLIGLPFMPPAKKQEGRESEPDPNQRMLQGLKAGAQLQRNNKPPIPCSRLFEGSGDQAREVLLFFPRGSDPITEVDRTVALECHFPPYYLSVKFAVNEMTYKGDLSL